MNIKKFFTKPFSSFNKKESESSEKIFDEQILQPEQTPDQNSEEEVSPEIKTGNWEDFSSQTKSSREAEEGRSNSYTYVNEEKKIPKFKDKLNLTKRLPSKKTTLVIFSIITLGGVLYMSLKSIPKNSILGEQANITNSVTINKPDVSPAKSIVTLNKESTFSVSDANGNKVSEFKYIIESAELRDEIIVKGQKATAVKGRTFLILNIKLKNDKNKNLEINTRDYIRLSTNNNDWLAPDIHNDPVDIQAISTKYSRVGFAIDDNIRNFKLKVGEIDGDKNNLDLQFR